MILEEAIISLMIKMTIKLANKTCPSEDDILLGKGGVTFKHSGNAKLREQCKNLAPFYDNSDRKMKAKIIEDLLEIILKTSRFLKKVKNAKPAVWIDADYKTSREKVSQTLRDSVAESKFGSTKRNRKLRVHKGKNTLCWSNSSSPLTECRIPQSEKVHKGDENNPWDYEQGESLTSSSSSTLVGANTSVSPTTIVDSDQIYLHRGSYALTKWFIDIIEKENILREDKIQRNRETIQYGKALEEAETIEKKDLLKYQPTSVIFPKQYVSTPITQKSVEDPIDILKEMEHFFEEVDFLSVPFEI